MAILANLAFKQHSLENHFYGFIGLVAIALSLFLVHLQRNDLEAIF